MKITQIIQETTTAGSVAPVEHSFVKMQTRNPSVYGSTKTGNLLKGKKTNKPFANSLNEGAMKDLAYDLQVMKPAEFQKKYGKSREEVNAILKRPAKPIQPQKPTLPVNEADLQEDDVILVPGKGIKVKPGFHKIDPDKAEHEGQTLKNSLHTIIRVATQLDKQLSTQEHFPEWVSEKIGAIKGMMTSVADYLVSDEEMQNDPDAVAEGAKVDRMVKHIEKSEKKLGHSKKEAENIAWATANKRGMLDNKNKKAK